MRRICNGATPPSPPPAASVAQAIASGACGLALIALSVPRGTIRRSYGGWNRKIV